MYSVGYESNKVKKSLNSYHPDERERILDKIEEKLRHYHPLTKGVRKIGKNQFRIRIGNQRVVFRKYDKEKVIIIELIRPRDKVYKDQS
jgi:mRNA-degrading endonuclease RelE of RelBE toxin-antitoxin system